VKQKEVQRLVGLCVRQELEDREQECLLWGCRGADVCERCLRPMPKPLEFYGKGILKGADSSV
jgi:hypothetical protein